MTPFAAKGNANGHGGRSPIAAAAVKLALGNGGGGGGETEVQEEEGRKVTSSLCKFKVPYWNAKALVGKGGGGCFRTSLETGRKPGSQN